jgi:hypothetical protein
MDYVDVPSLPLRPQALANGQRGKKGSRTRTHTATSMARGEFHGLPELPVPKRDWPPHSGAKNLLLLPVNFDA